jgi:hypothetical protein
MREFAVTSKKFTGCITFGYDENGQLVKFLFDAIMDDAYVDFVRRNIPWTVDAVARYKSKTSTVTEITDISFERFWRDYDYKKGKDAAIKEWNKLKQGEQVKAIVRIPAYKFDINARNVAPVYPERYLKHKRFNDE